MCWCGEERKVPVWQLRIVWVWFVPEGTGAAVVERRGALRFVMYGMGSMGLLGRVLSTKG